MIDWFVRAGMSILMFGMGLALTRSDFARVWLYPKATLVGTVVQLLAMPLAGIALALGFGLSPMYAAGLVICAACPGGAFSNMVVHLGKADTALSITLTATATAATLVTLPFWVRAILSAVGGESAQIEVPVLDTALSLGAVTIVPVAIGMFVRERVPQSRSFEKLATRLGVAIVFAALTYQGLHEDGETFADYEQAIAPVAALLATAAVLGYAIPLLLRIPVAQSATIGVEVCLKNTVLGIFLATQSLDLQAAVPLAMYMTFHLPVSIAIVVSYRLWARRAGQAPFSDTEPIGG